MFSFAYYIYSCSVTYSDYGNFLLFNYRNAFTSLFFFWWGGLIYFASLHLKFRFRVRTSMFFGSLFLLAIILSEKIVVFSNPSFNFIQWQILILIFAIPILLSSPLNRIHQPVNSFFGDLSYPLYVTHMSVVGVAFIVLAYLEKINPLLYSVFDRAITSQLTIWTWILPLSIIVAILATYLIEKPVLSFRNKVLHINNPKELEDSLGKVKFGLADIPIYLQSFGLSSTLARASGSILIVSLIAYFVNNKDASINKDIPYRAERELLISLFKGSFGDTLVDGSTIQFENESPLHKKELFNFLTKKSLHVVIPPNNKFDFKIRYSINSDFAQINIKKYSSDIEDMMVFKKEKDDRWTEVYSNEKSHYNGILLPPFFNGFYAWEGKVGSFCWASKNANILWINTDDKPKQVKISFNTGSLISRQITVKHNRKNIDNFTISPGVVSAHSYSILLSPGRNTIEFVTPEPAVKPNEQDTRDLTFSIAKLTIEQ